MRRDESHAADVAVYDVLRSPRTTTEITMVLRQKLWDAYEEETGESIAYWDEVGGHWMPAPGVRLLAFGNARDLIGFPMLTHAQVYNRLVKFEKLGLIQRLMLPGHSRSVLWFRITSAPDTPPR